MLDVLKDDDFLEGEGTICISFPTPNSGGLVPLPRDLRPCSELWLDQSAFWRSCRQKQGLLFGEPKMVYCSGRLRDLLDIVKTRPRSDVRPPAAVITTACCMS